MEYMKYERWIYIPGDAATQSYIILDIIIILSMLILKAL